MKKLLCALLAVLLLCSLCACGGETPKATEPTEKNNPGTNATQSQQQNTEATNPTEKTEVTLDSFRFPRTEVYCKLPDTYGRLTNGTVAATTGSDEFMATICVGDAGAYTADTAGIFNFMAKKYTNDVNKYLSPDAKEDGWNISSTKGTKVSGYDATQLSGTVSNTDGGTYQIYGYSVIVDEMPVMFVGILNSKDQAQKDLNEMKALVDQMAGSIYKK